MIIAVDDEFGVPRVTTCIGLVSSLPIIVTVHSYSPASLSLTVTVTLVTSGMSGSDALTESTCTYCV